MRTVRYDGHEWQVLREIRLEDGTLVLNLVRADAASGSRHFWSARASECEEVRVGETTADVRQADLSNE